MVKLQPHEIEPILRGLGSRVCASFAQIPAAFVTETRYQDRSLVARTNPRERAK